MTNKIIQLNDSFIEIQHAPIYPELEGTSPTSITCSNCGYTYIPEIWISINDDLRPICPYCGDP